MDGGRRSGNWTKKPWSKEPEQKYPATTYKAKPHNNAIRAFRDETLQQCLAKKPLIDVRSTGEYTGEMLHMPDYPQEGALRAGHIPGAVSIPWPMNVKDDGTFKPAAELQACIKTFLQMSTRLPIAGLVNVRV